MFLPVGSGTLDGRRVRVCARAKAEELSFSTRSTAAATETAGQRQKQTACLDVSGAKGRGGHTTAG